MIIRNGEFDPDDLDDIIRPEPRDIYQENKEWIEEVSEQNYKG